MITNCSRAALALLCLIGASVRDAAAQPASSRPPAVLEGSLGWAGFTDEEVVHHTLIGGAARVYVSPRLSVGPEVVYMRGPASDRDLMVTGTLTIDILAPDASRRRATPFVVVGGGLFRHADRFQSGTFASTEGAVTVGLGARAWLTPRAFVAADVRLGWELHARVAGTIGIALKRD